jgi:hypothetical protein
MAVTEQEFFNIIDTNPMLCSWGWWAPIAARTMKLDYDFERDFLRGQFKEFAFCVDWLNTRCTPIKTASTNSPTTRTLQQIAKNECPGYVGNGAMLAAVIYCRIPYKPTDDDPNPSVAISLKSDCFKTAAP